MINKLLKISFYIALAQFIFILGFVSHKYKIKIIFEPFNYVVQYTQDILGINFEKIGDRSMRRFDKLSDKQLDNYTNFNIYNKPKNDFEYLLFLKNDVSDPVLLSGPDNVVWKWNLENFRNSETIGVHVSTDKPSINSLEGYVRLVRPLDLSKMDISFEGFSFVEAIETNEELQNKIVDDSILPNATAKEYIEDLKKYSESYKYIILVGNKIDLYNRIVSYEDAEKYAISENCMFVETSILLNTNVDKIFDTLIDQIDSEVLNNKLIPSFDNGLKIIYLTKKPSESSIISLEREQNRKCCNIS